MKIDIIPYRARHAKLIKPDVDERLAWLAQEMGPAYTGFLLGKPIGAAGISIQSPEIAEAWTILSEAAYVFPFALHRRVARGMMKIIKEQKLKKIYALCGGNEVEKRWLERLGFKRTEPTGDINVPEGQQLYLLEVG